MELIILMVFGYGLWRGAQDAAAAIGKSYRSRRDRWAKQAPVQNKASRVGFAAAAGATTAVTGVWDASRGFVQGARRGAAEGRERANARRAAHTPDEQTRPDEPPAAPVKPDTETTQVDPPAPAAEQTPATPEPGTRPKLRAVPPVADTPPDQPTGTAPDAGAEHTNGGDPMAIDTVTGGEVLSMDQLIAELEAIKKEASSDMDDAHADATRAAEDAQRIELTASSLQALDLDAQTIAEVSALAESAQARQEAAELRAQAAEARHAQASQALEGVQARHGLMREAVAGTEHVADKQFYTGS